MRAGYALVLAEHHYDLDAEMRVAGQLMQHGVDAFVFVGLDHHAGLFSLLEDYGRPYVLTWGVDPTGAIRASASTTRPRPTR